MPRVNIKKKSSRGKEVKCGRCGVLIEPGTQYKKWSFRFGGDRFRCMKPECAPRGSDLTQGRIGEVYSLNERLEDACSDLRKNHGFEDFKSEVESIRDDAESVADDFQSGFDNMPEGLQQGDTGQNIEARIEALGEFQSELNSTLDNVDWPEDEDAEASPTDHGEEVSPLDHSGDDKPSVADKADEIAGEFDGISCDCD